MTDALRWARQQKMWASLRGLHPRPIDLERTALIRHATLDDLSHPASLERILQELGLNDEAIDELPPELHAYAGTGLRIWQYPNQFSRYLIALSRLRVRSYLEIGIRHGGSFVATAEYLERFHPLDVAVGVDVIPCAAMAAYEQLNPKARFWCVNTRAAELVARLDELGTVDLVFIDSHHEEDQCRAELDLLAPRARIIAFHDIANVGCPGIQRVWRELAQSSAYACSEYVDQYGLLGPFMGIGLAIRKQHEVT